VEVSALISAWRVISLFCHLILTDFSIIHYLSLKPLPTTTTLEAL
jgi:hypothetical protein